MVRMVGIEIDGHDDGLWWVVVVDGERGDS